MLSKVCAFPPAGIALASNLGGMTSPISSPQNIFAIQEMGRDGEPPSWLAWFAVALPVACLGNFACWGLLLLAYRPGRTLKEVRRMPSSSVRPPPVLGGLLQILSTLL